MKNLSKRSLIITFALILIISFILPFNMLTVSAEDDDYYGGDHTDQERFEYKNKDTGYEAVIIDAGDYLTDSEAKKALKIMEDITEYTNIVYYSLDIKHCKDSESWTRDQIIDVVEDEFGRNEPAVGYITTWYWGYMYAQEEALGVISPAKARTICDNVYELAEEDWSLEINEVMDEVLILFQGGSIAQPMKYICNALVGILSGLLICYLIVDNNSKLKRASSFEMVKGADKNVRPGAMNVQLTDQTRVYSPQSSGSGGGHGGGGHGGGGGHAH